MNYYINTISNKSVFILCSFIGQIVLFSCNTTSNNAALDFYNQPLPDENPKVFAPGIISRKGSYEYPCSFSNDMSEMFFGVNLFENGNNQRYILYVKKLSDDTWSTPRRISFTGFPESEPILSPDNSQLFFNVHSDSTKEKPHDIWYVDKVDSKWSSPIRLNNEINSPDYEYYTTSSNENRIYFTREEKGIYTAVLKNKQFVDIHPIDSTINNMKWVGHPYISPNEDYLIFDSSEPGGYGSADLYITFKSNNKWGKPINLGEKINTPLWDAMPIVSPDGEYLFFCREGKEDRDIYWVKFHLNDYRQKDKLSL